MWGCRPVAQHLALKPEVGRPAELCVKSVPTQLGYRIRLCLKETSKTRSSLPSESLKSSGFLDLPDLGSVGTPVTAHMESVKRH